MRPISRLLNATRQARLYSTKQKSPHAQWYDDVVPAMVPICLLGSAIYLGLQLTRIKLSHEKYMEEAEQRIAALEEQIKKLR